MPYTVATVNVMKRVLYNKYNNKIMHFLKFGLLTSANLFGNFLQNADCVFYNYLLLAFFYRGIVLFTAVSVNTMDGFFSVFVSDSMR